MQALHCCVKSLIAAQQVVMCIVYDAAELSRCLTGSHMYSPRWAREPSRCLTGSYVNTLAMRAIHIAALRAAG